MNSIIVLIEIFAILGILAFIFAKYCYIVVEDGEKLELTRKDNKDRKYYYCSRCINPLLYSSKKVSLGWHLFKQTNDIVFCSDGKELHFNYYISVVELKTTPEFEEKIVEVDHVRLLGITDETEKQEVFEQVIESWFESYFSDLTYEEAKNKIIKYSEIEKDFDGYLLDSFNMESATFNISLNMNQEEQTKKSEEALACRKLELNQDVEISELDKQESVQVATLNYEKEIEISNIEAKQKVEIEENRKKAEVVVSRSLADEKIAKNQMEAEVEVEKTINKLHNDAKTEEETQEKLKRVETAKASYEMEKEKINSEKESYVNGQKEGVKREKSNQETETKIKSNENELRAATSTHELELGKLKLEHELKLEKLALEKKQEEEEQAKLKLSWEQKTSTELERLRFTQLTNVQIDLEKTKLEDEITRLEEKTKLELKNESSKLAAEIRLSELERENKIKIEYEEKMRDIQVSLIEANTKQILSLKDCGLSESTILIILGKNIGTEIIKTENQNSVSTSTPQSSPSQTTAKTTPPPVPASQMTPPVTPVYDDD